LRCAHNVITGADNRWISYTFDSPASALPLEGMTGSGDSGGPVLVEEEGQWKLAGLASWTYVQGDIHRTGRYGDGGYSIRISRYAEWIESIVSGE
jgi:secreted trypsin-like serine protease